MPNPCCGVETCDDLTNCCDEPQAFVKENECSIEPVQDCVDVSTILPDENTDQTFYEALLMSEDGQYLLVSEDCKPFYGKFVIEE